MALVVGLPGSLSAASLLLIKAAALLLLTTTEALAQKDRLALTWNAPPGCPPESEITDAVLTSADEKNAAASRVQAPAGPTLIARAQISHRSDGTIPPTWHVLLRTQRGDAHGQREIEAESCPALAQATVVVLSLALLDLEESSDAESGSQALPTADFDRYEAVSEASPSRSDSKRRPQTHPSAVEAETAPSKNKRAPSDMSLAEDKPPPGNQDSARPVVPRASKKIDGSLARFSVGARVGFNLGTLPRFAPGGAFSLAWLPDPFRLEFDARMWGRQSQSIQDTPSGARLSLSSLGVRACVKATGTPRLDLAPCLGSELHLLRAQGFGSDSNYDVRANWTALTAGLLARAPVTSHFALRAEVEGQVPLDRPRFFVERLGTVHRIPPVAVTTLFGVEAHFP